MSVGTKSAIDGVVLNTILANAQDISVINNVFSVTGLGENIKLEDIGSISKIAFAAGTAAVKEIDTPTTPAASFGYSVKIFQAGDAGATNNAKTAVVWSATTGETEASLTNKLVTQINLTFADLVTADNNSDNVRLTQTSTSLAGGDILVETNVGAVSVTTPFVAPAGTPEIVAALNLGTVSQTAQYVEWRVFFDNRIKEGFLYGGKRVFKNEFVSVFVDQLASNFSTFESTMDGIGEVTNGVALPLFLDDAAVALDYALGEIKSNTMIFMTPTADRIVTINNAPAGFNVKVVNLSAGAFDISIKPSSGTAVDVAQNKRNEVWFQSATVAHLLVP